MRFKEKILQQMLLTYVSQKYIYYPTHYTTQQYQ